MKTGSRWEGNSIAAPFQLFAASFRRKLSAEQLSPDAAFTLFGKCIVELGTLINEQVNVDAILASDAPAEIKPTHFRILYSKDLNKAVKKWEDGYGKWFPTKAIAEYYDCKNALIHRRQCESIDSGTLIETPRYVIEVIGVTDEAFPQAKSPKETEAGAKPKIALNLEPNESVLRYAIVYTSDKHKKQNRKWLDGVLEYNPEKRLCIIRAEDSRLIHKRIVEPSQVQPSSELETGQYLIQICEQIAEAAQAKENELPAQESVRPAVKKMKVTTNTEVPTDSCGARSTEELLAFFSAAS
mgnify:CR=1 FL=1